LYAKRKEREREKEKEGKNRQRHGQGEAGQVEGRGLEKKAPRSLSATIA